MTHRYLSGCIVLYCNAVQATGPSISTSSGVYFSSQQKENSYVNNLDGKKTILVQTHLAFLVRYCFLNKQKEINYIKDRFILLV